MSRPATSHRDYPSRVPLRQQIPVYIAGIFSNGGGHVYSIIIPIWMLQIDPSPIMVGMALGSRQLLPVLLSIHGGALMDRIGIRRVMIGFAAIGAVSPFLFPLFPFFTAVVFLQMVTGVAMVMGWIGTQAQIGAHMGGDASYAGRVTFFNRLGAFAGPPVAGAAWDLGGPWGGFGFLGLWGIALFAACIAMPVPDTPAGTSTQRDKPAMTLRDVLPRTSDYAAAFRLMALPAIAFVVATTILRHTSNGIQMSFYVVYLESIGFPGTVIGVLVGASSILGGLGALCAGWLARTFTSYWVLVSCICLSILMVAITPLLGSIALLLTASALRGGTMGATQPLLISLLAQSAGSAQGKGVGLRTTANRLSVLLTPVLMGGIAQLIGIEAAFYVMGAILLALMGITAFHFHTRFVKEGQKP